MESCEIELFISIKVDLSLNNLQRLIRHKPKQINKKYSSLFYRLGIVPTTLSMTGITVTFLLHNCFNSLASYYNYQNYYYYHFYYYYY